MNGVDKSIQFTAEIDFEANSVNFLDLKISIISRKTDLLPSSFAVPLKANSLHPSQPGSFQPGESSINKMSQSYTFLAVTITDTRTRTYFQNHFDC